MRYASLNIKQSFITYRVVGISGHMQDIFKEVLCSHSLFSELYVEKNNSIKKAEITCKIKQTWCELSIWHDFYHAWKQGLFLIVGERCKVYCRLQH